jgi:formylglycine-generating enzyme required for sulfatase activity
MLAEAQVAALIKGGAPDGRLKQYITECGGKFSLDGDTEKRLRAAGTTAAVVDLLRKNQALSQSAHITQVKENSIGMEFVMITAGKFMMGCSPEDTQCKPDENPRHEVTIRKSFEMGKYKVTQAQ